MDVINQPRQPQRSGTPSRPAASRPITSRPAERPNPSLSESPFHPPQPTSPISRRKSHLSSKPWQRFRFTRKIGILSVIVVALIVSGIIIAIIGSAKSSTPKTASVQPPYSTVLPANKSIEKLGGWQRISPAGSDPVYAYADSLSGVAIGVSEQPLPASFASDPDTQLADLAKKFNATDQISAGSTKIYVGTSFQGPQSAILSKKGLLILIKSKSKINDSAWSSYAESLR